MLRILRNLRIKLRVYLSFIQRNPDLLAYAIRHPRYDAIKDHYEQMKISKLEQQGLMACTGAGMPFHNDPILQLLVKSSIDHFKVSTFFETGTFKADSLLYLIHEFENKLKYVSCEVNDEFFKYAVQRLQQDSLAKNMLNHSIAIFNLSSPAAIRKYFKSADPDELTLWWLDAHWYSYWPLQDELKEILRFASKALIFIDDFRVPSYNYPVPAYASYGGHDNNMEYIDEILNIQRNPEKFDILFPAYESKSLQGYTPSYVAIYMNLKDNFNKFESEQELIKHFIKWSD